MIRKTKTLSAALAALICAHPICAYAAEYGLGRSAAVPGLTLPTAPTQLNANPALMSGVPSLEAITPAMRAASIPSLPAAIPAAAAIAPAAAAKAAAEPVAQGPKASARMTLTAIGNAVTSSEVSGAAKAAPEASLSSAFDGSKASGGSDGVVPPGGNDGVGGNGNGGNGGNNNGGDDGGDDGARLDGLHSRVVIMLDTLDGPASDELVARIEKMVDLGVRVVFVTSRPDKGPGSADELLLSKLRIRTQNPVIAVTFNGARVTARSSRAENPKPLIDDAQGFAAPVVANFRATNDEMARIFNLGKVREFGVPAEGDPYIYGVELPKDADMSRIVSFYNTKLRALGYKYKMEGRTDEGGRQYIFTQSTALKLNVGRVFKGLYAQNPSLRDDLKREEVLVLANSDKAQGFLSALQEEETVGGKGFVIHNTRSSVELTSSLGSFLGVEALKKEKVTRYQLRAYMDWKAQKEKWGAPRSGGNGGSGKSGQPASYRKFYRGLAFYRGVIMYDLMGRLYKTLRNGQYFNASPEAAQDLLEKMWYYPLSNGVRLSPELEAQRHSPVWRALSRGYLESAKVWLANYYKRNFPSDWPTGVNQRVMGTMMNIAPDGKNNIKVEYVSPVARYQIGMLPARTNVYKGADGHWVLEGHVYRTGVEPYQEEFEDSIEKNLLAHAVLRGYGDHRADGKWYVNGEADPRVRIVFHYMTRELDDVMTPEQIGQDGARITSTISEMLADSEFMAYWAEQEEENSKTAGKAAHAAELKAAKLKKKYEERAAKVGAKKARKKTGKKTR